MRLQAQPAGIRGKCVQCGYPTKVYLTYQPSAVSRERAEIRYLCDDCRQRSPWGTAAYPNRKARRKIERGMRPNAY